MELDIKETFRYLGYRGQDIDEDLKNMIIDTGNELKNVITPKSVSRTYECKVEEDNVSISSLNIKSKNLAKNLRGCEKVVLFAATLGVNPDMLIKRYSVSNVTKAAIIQAAGASLIETFCDELEDGIREEAQKNNMYLRPRFSPGYGDFSIEYQKEIFGMLECNKRIGLTLTDSFLMIPSKSVTALIGISKEERKNCHREKCQGCTNTQCEYRDN